MKQKYSFVIKQLVREIEALLGPSFSPLIYARALRYELMCKGIYCQIEQWEEEAASLRIGEAIIWVRGKICLENMVKEKDSSGIWVPHKYLILPQFYSAA